MTHKKAAIIAKIDRINPKIDITLPLSFAIPIIETTIQGRAINTDMPTPDGSSIRDRRKETIPATRDMIPRALPLFFCWYGCRYCCWYGC